LKRRGILTGHRLLNVSTRESGAVEAQSSEMSVNGTQQQR
jgi:hypothetical protein